MASALDHNHSAQAALFCGPPSPALAAATAGLVGAAIVADEGSARYDQRGYYGGSGYYAPRGSPYDTGFYGSPPPYLRGGCDVWGC